MSDFEASNNAGGDNGYKEGSQDPKDILKSKVEELLKATAKSLESKDISHYDIKDLNKHDPAFREQRPKFYTLAVNVKFDGKYMKTPVYLDTDSMEMNHGPVLYYPDRRISSNLSTIWKLTHPGPDHDGTVLENYVTPDAIPALHTRDHDIHTVRFQEGSAAHSLKIHIQGRDDGLKLRIKYKDEEYSLLPIENLSSNHSGNSHSQEASIKRGNVVACPTSKIQSHEDDMWSLIDVTGLVALHPIKDK